MSTLTTPINRWYSWETCTPLMYPGLLTIAEACISLGFSIAGLSIYGIVLLILAMRSVTSRESGHWLLLCLLGLVSMLRFLAVYIALPYTPWIIWYVLVGLWGILLLVAIRRVIRRPAWLDKATMENADLLYIAETPVSSDTPPVDADTAEQLAFMLWAWFSPVSVLVVAHNQAEDQAMVELAVGASGCRLRGFEGIRQPWSAFALMLAQSTKQGDFLATTTHPFSQHHRDYLILAHPELQRWFIVSLDGLDGGRVGR